MLSHSTKSLSFALLGVAVMSLSAARALGQDSNPPFRVAPNLSAPAAFDAGVVRGDRGSNQAAFRTVVANPYFATGAYVPYYDPYGGFTSGVADIVASQGQFMKDREQSFITREQSKQARIDTRRKNFDEWMYEQAHTPTLEDRREQARLENLRRSRNDPPLTEIWDGKALNDLLIQLQKEIPPSEGMAPYVSLEPDVVAHINVTSGTTLGSLGVLKNDGKLRWPLPLKTEEYNEQRKRLEALIPKAIQQAQSGDLDVKTFRALGDLIDQMVDQVNQSVGTITTRDFIESKRYLGELDSSIKVLRDMDAGKYIAKKWAAKGNTVYALVAGLTAEGLKFAPAVDGDQAAYVALHRAMVSFETGLMQARR